uniref:M16 family metallopeptidase n=1 Tax=Desertifilum tharense IPPAS B-1220 TaxID=1781255 RepID=A0ACD5GYW2_9CYAN
MSQLLTLPQFPAQICPLTNGLTLIHQAIPATPVVVVDVWVQAGAKLDPEDAPGMAHFLEHMIFKGTNRLAAGIFDEAIESRGGLSNAATSYDYAHFFMTTAVVHLKETLPYLAELLLHPAIPEEEFFREREVVMDEIRQTQDDPDWLGFQTLLENLYPSHPYGRSVLGSQIQLMQQTPEQMRAFHRQHYRPDNMSVVVVGGIEQSQAFDLVSECFAEFETSHFPPCPLLNRPPITPRLTQPYRRELNLPRLEQARLMMAWLGTGVDSLRSAYGLDLISVLLASGRTSRLVRQLREEQGLVQGICGNFSLQKESSLFTLTAWLEPQELPQVEELIRESLLQLQTVPVSEAELLRCQRQLCNDYAFSTETPSQLAGLYGYYNTIAQAEQSAIYTRYIQSLQPEDIQALVQQYLSPDCYSAIVMKPLW